MTCIYTKTGENLSEYAKRNKLPYAMLWRLVDEGFSVDEAVFYTKVNHGKGCGGNRAMPFRGETCLRAYCRKNKIPYGKLFKEMVIRDLSEEQAVALFEEGTLGRLK
jgi:hypothetical protein